MKRNLPGRRVLGAAVLTAALVVPVALFAGSGSAESTTAAQAQYAPSNTAAPTISGDAQVGSTLTANAGSWASTTDVSYSYQWQRCNAQGGACVDISGATSQTYKVAQADDGNKLRVVVSARNKDGTTRANSATTDVVGSKTTQATQTGSLIKESNGRTSIAVADVKLPDRLVIDDVKFAPNPVPTKQPITARFHIKDVDNGYDVRDALVYAIGLPYSRVKGAPEVKTGTDGWAQITFQPDKFFPRKGYITFFVRARSGGGDLLAGSSTRRLVQVTIR